MPEGTVVCQLEEKTGDRGTIARASGNLFILNLTSESLKMMKPILSIGL
jgi:ribosomal protein L2